MGKQRFLKLLLLGLIGVIPLIGQAQTKLVAWEFDTTNNTVPPSKTFEATAGTGELTFYAKAGYSLAAEDIASGNVKFKAPNNSGLSGSDWIDGTKHDNYMQLSFSTKGYKNPVISFACASDSGTKWHLVYSADGGTTWQDAGEYMTDLHWGTAKTFSDIAISATNKEKVLVRILNVVSGVGHAEFDTRFKSFVVNAEEKKEVSFTNESITATWEMTKGDECPSEAILSLDGAISISSFAIGSNLSYKKINNYQEVKGGEAVLPMTTYTPKVKSTADTEGNNLEYKIKPVKGLTFQPTNVSFNCGRFGTGGGYLNIKLRYADGTEKVLANGVHPNRSAEGTTPLSYTVCSYDISDMAATSEEITLIINIYNLDPDKEVGFNNVVISGKMNGTAEDVPTYTLSTEVNPVEAGNINMSPAGAEFEKGTPLSLTAVPNFGYKFIKWVDAEGKDVSVDNPYAFEIKENTVLKAEFEAVNTYTFSTRCINDREMNFGSLTLNPEPTNSMYEEGTVVTITANESPIAIFSNWADEFENSNLPKVRTVTVNQDMEIVANYQIQDFIAAFNAEKVQGYANKDSYPFGADYTWDNERNASASVVKIADNQAVKGNGSTPVVRLRTGCVISTVNGLYTNGYRSTDIGLQIQFSTLGFESARFTGDLVAKNGANKNWKVLYSVNGTEFKPVTVEGAELTYELTTSIARKVEFDLPAEAMKQATVYIRFTGTGEEVFDTKYQYSEIEEATGLDYTSNSETGLGNIYIFGTPEDIPDAVPPVVNNITPKDNATGVSSNGKIMISYDERIKPGTGEATLVSSDGKSVVLEPEYGSTFVSFRYYGLSYSTTYTLHVPAGYVTDRSNNNAPEVTSSFTIMDRVKPEARLFNAIVDGSLAATIDPTANEIGQYKTIQEAINAAPADNTKPWLIFIKAGYYNDLNNLTFPSGKFTWENPEGKLPATEDSRIVLVNKPFIHLIGEDVDKVTIAQDRVCGENAADKTQAWYNVAEGATLVVTANDFYCENITIDNEWWTKYTGTGARGPQALALYVEADRAAFNNCRIRSYQDTYLSPKTGNINTGNQQPHYFDRNYFNNCVIEGAVDFIYGGGDVYFDNCTLNIVREEGGYIVAPSHYEDLKDENGNITEVRTRFGYVFKNTTITAPKSKESSTKVYFGRPWHGAPKAVYIDTECHIQPYKGIWCPTMSAIPAIFAVYNMWDANGYPMSTESIEDYFYYKDGIRIEGKAKNFLTDEEAASYTIDNVLKGDGTDAKTGIWNPLPVIEKTATPVIEGKEGETTISWSGDEYAICYILTINGIVADFTTETTYKANLDDVVTVQSVNEYGALSEPSAPYTVGKTPVNVSEVESNKITVIAGKGTVSVRGIEEETSVLVFNLSGMLVEKIETDHNVSFALPAGQYIIKANSEAFKAIVR